MKLTLSTLLILLISIGNSIAQPSDSPKTIVAFTNATVIDGTGAALLENATVVIEGKRIACVGECKIPDGAKAIDAKGKYIIPGLVDAHVHYDGTGWLDAWMISVPWKKERSPTWLCWSEIHSRIFPMCAA